MATTALAALPSWAREMYAGSLLAPVISKVPLADAATSASMWAWRRALLVVPERIRKSPHVAAAEERLGLAALHRQVIWWWSDAQVLWHPNPDSR